MKFLLAIDQGTTSSRSIVFTKNGEIVSAAQKEFRQLFPKPGWVEHDAEEIWSTQSGTITEALAKGNIRAENIAAIGITNQRETVVLWDRETGKPVANAIVWQDRRTAGYCDRLKAAGHSSTIRRKTGLVIDAYFSASKLRWLLDNVPGARKRAEAGKLAFGTIDSWLVWKLTNGKLHVTDPSNASRTMLFNINTGAWDPGLLKLFNIPVSVLPEVRSSSEVYGTAIEVVPGVPIAGIAGDQQAALFGQVCTKPGMVKNTYGTGCFMLMNTGTKPVFSKNKLLTTVAWKIGARTEYALEGSIFIAGAVVQYLRDSLGIIRTSADVEPLARSVPDNGGVYFVPAFVGLGAPHWDPFARGAIIGLTRGSNAGHIARAALESICYQVSDVLVAMQADSGIRLRELRVDGGAVVNNLLMQFQADMLDRPVICPKVPETTALGAAYLAGLAVGFYKNQDEIAANWRIDRSFRPAIKSAERKLLESGWKRALGRSRNWVTA
jgi:glycerol kinase